MLEKEYDVTIRFVPLERVAQKIVSMETHLVETLPPARLRVEGAEITYASVVTAISPAAALRDAVMALELSVVGSAGQLPHGRFLQAIVVPHVRSDDGTSAEGGYPGAGEFPQPLG